MPPGVDPVVTVAEEEGVTVVATREEVESAGLTYGFEAAWITLRAHSALDLVGLTAAVSHRLTEAGIPCNVVAGHFHDHLFVPAERAQEAMGLLGPEPFTRSLK